MRDGDIFDFERIEIELCAGMRQGDVDLWRARLVQSSHFQEARRKGRGEDLALEPRPQGREPADMVLMRMCDANADKIARDLLDEGDIRKDEVDARRLRPGKAEAAIDHQPFARFRRAEAIERHVHADFAQAAKRQEDEVGFGRRHATSPAAVCRGPSDTSPASTARGPLRVASTSRPIASIVSKRPSTVSRGSSTRM